ncbi:MAG: VOC family protein [Saprospiraceae bacterium]|jgi:predicted enzyme related to lactoylglutathione lyase|nr:VOC family protein [Saprospiraceae bacterium]MBK9564015.1 VOC family protein [Saprospiraceae bacterium]MBP6445404.1 VOC family protein [Saprospiraceae bacterium]
MNAISWFELPAIDIERAQKFYEKIFGITMLNLDNPNLQMRAFPFKNIMDGVSGALVCNKDFYTPTANQGALLYLNANPDLQQVLDKVSEAGGKVFIPKTKINDNFGFMAIFLDSEGNRVGLQSIN